MTTPFYVVTPTMIDDMNFVSSTVPENDFPVYSEATTYPLGARVIVTTGYHKIYESLVASNTGNFPPTNPTRWLEVGPTNRWAAFDQSGNTLVTATDSIEFAITGNRFGSVGLLEVQASSVRIRASTLVDGTYYDKTYTLPDRSVVSNWYEYLYQPISKQKQFVVTDIPPISGSTYTITVTNNGPVSLGTFVFGNKSEFGFTQYNATIGIIDYSRKDVNQFGTATLTKRNFSKRMDVSVFMESVLTDSITTKLQDLRATPALWVAAQDSYEVMTIYGFYRDFSIDIAFPTQTVGSLQIEGLT
jgi:hypothetical protein